MGSRQPREVIFLSLCVVLVPMKSEDLGVNHGVREGQVTWDL